jgi:hypothetical protein
MLLRPLSSSFFPQNDKNLSKWEQSVSNTLINFPFFFFLSFFFFPFLFLLSHNKVLAGLHQISFLLYIKDGT